MYCNATVLLQPLLQLQLQTEMDWGPRHRAVNRRWEEGGRGWTIMSFTSTQILLPGERAFISLRQPGDWCPPDGRGRRARRHASLTARAVWPFGSAGSACRMPATSVGALYQAIRAASQRDGRTVTPLLQEHTPSKLNRPSLAQIKT